MVCVCSSSSLNEPLKLAFSKLLLLDDERVETAAATGGNCRTGVALTATETEFGDCSGGGGVKASSAPVTPRSNLKKVVAKMCKTVFFWKKNVVDYLQRRTNGFVRAV